MLVLSSIQGNMSALSTSNGRDSGGHEQLSIVIRVVISKEDNKDVI